MAKVIPRRDAISEIRHLLEQQRPLAHCDGCLALRLHISLVESRAAAHRLADERGFSRQRSECYTCRRTVELTTMRRKRS